MSPDSFFAGKHSAPPGQQRAKRGLLVRQTQHHLLGYRSKNTKCPDFTATDQLEEQETADAAYASICVPNTG